MMSSRLPGSTRGGRRAPRQLLPGGSVVDMVPARIKRALAARERYKYVQPRVEPEGSGWKIVSPNCSRNIDAQGGDIAIAWLLPAASSALTAGGAAPGRLWTLYARDHAQACWRLEGSGLTLDQALQRVCADPLRMYWP